MVHDLISLQKVLQAGGFYLGALDGEVGPLTWAGICSRARMVRGAHVGALQAAAADHMVLEIPGRKSHPRIVEMHRRAGVSEGSAVDETAWCGSAACSWVCDGGGVPPAKAAWAANWRKWGRGAVIGEEKANGKTAAGELVVVPGDVVLFPRTGGSGYHVALYVTHLPGVVYYVGGNQRDRVSLLACKPEAVAAFRHW